VGLAPQGERAHLACVEQAPGAPARVRWVHSADWRAPAAALRSLRRRLRSHRRVLLLQRTQYQLLPLEAPDVPRADWAEATRWKLKDLVDFPVDQASVDVLALPADATTSRGAQLLAVAAPHAALRPLAAAADDAGTPWAAIDVPETALRNLSALLQPEGRAQALLHLGMGDKGDQGTLVVTHAGELLLTRHIDHPPLAGDGTAHDTAAFDRIGLELQRTLDGFERLYSHLPLARLLVSPSPGHEALCRHVAELLYVPVQPLLHDNLLDPVLDWRSLPELAAPGALHQHLCAIGAALRA
jgi:MSHA biogenesis protein MshI